MGNSGGSSTSDDVALPVPQGQFLVYADGTSQLQVRQKGNTVWLMQKLIAERYDVTVPTVNQHLRTIYEEGELPPDRTIKHYLIVRREGATIRNFRIVQREGSLRSEIRPVKGDACKLTGQNFRVCKTDHIGKSGLFPSVPAVERSSRCYHPSKPDGELYSTV